MTDQTTAQPLTDQQLDEIDARANAALHCPNAEANGRLDGQHTLSGSFSHIRCELCTYTRPRGERVEETAALVAEVRRLRAELAAARTAALAEAEKEIADAIDRNRAEHPASEPMITRRLGMRAAERVVRWLREEAEETHVVADDSDDPEHVDDCPGCEAFTLTGHVAVPAPAGE